MAQKRGGRRKRRPARPRTPPSEARSKRPRRTPLVVLLAGGLLIVTGVLLLARDDDRAVLATEGDPFAAGQVGAPDPGPVHVHGLGVDPADGALLIATHSGTFRAAAGEVRAQRIGDSRQDTMGFTVAGANHLFGSGHPDPQEAVERDLPPHLGLIESRDGGVTWRNLSLLGEADFHVLRFAAPRIYGYDASNDRLLVSRDSGRTWRTAARPAPLIDLAVDPADGRHLVASGQGGVYTSPDEGATWSRVGPHLGLLAWPARRRLYLIDGEGTLRRSSDAKKWDRVGSIGGAPAAFLAHTPSELYAALHDGTILQSRDSGRTWSVRSRP